MRNALAADLAKLEGMAFARVADCRELIERFHGLGQASPKSTVRGAKPVAGEGVRAHPDYGLLQKLYEWVFVPLSLWPVDVRGLGLHVLGCIEEGRELDGGARLMGELLPEAPPRTVCDPISEYEHAVKLGNYEGLI